MLAASWLSNLPPVLLLPKLDCFQPLALSCLVHLPQVISQRHTETHTHTHPYWVTENKSWFTRAVLTRTEFVNRVQPRKQLLLDVFQKQKQNNSETPTTVWCTDEIATAREKVFTERFRMVLSRLLMGFLLGSKVRLWYWYIHLKQLFTPWKQFSLSVVGGRCNHAFMDWYGGGTWKREK